MAGGGHKARHLHVHGLHLPGARVSPQHVLTGVVTVSVKKVKNVIFKVFDMLPLRVVWKRKDKLITDKFYQVLHKFC